MTARLMRSRQLLVAACLLLLAATGLVGACNSHPVEFQQASESVAVHIPSSPDSAAAVDILWVIDNSASMCEEQEALRTNFEKFISQITSRNIDFHLGVTTTQMDTYARDPVAVPGRLQSTPQPLPSSLPECRGDEGDPNDPMDGYQKVRQSIALAVECTSDPAQWSDLASLTDGEYVANLTDDEIDCQLPPRPESCDCPTPEDCGREKLFPTYDNGSPYRDIPKVLKLADYLDPRTKQLTDAKEEQLRKDFACMSFVGTSGFYIEKGLAAAAKAVSPEMTGGTVENPTDESAPNHGFLRDSAKFSVIFVTDETDCSHDGTLDEETNCGADICAMANHPDYEDSPLIPSEEFAEKIRTNLTDSKGYDVKEDSIIAASIHGRWKRYGATPNYPEGELPTQAECAALTDDLSESVAEATSCDTDAFGTAYSGDRYERFLRAFDPNQVFPKVPIAADEHMDGLICSPNQIADTLEQIGETIAGSVSSCIYQVPYRCETTDECPAYSYGGESAAECLPFGDSGQGYCNSGIQVRMYPGDNTFADLEAHEYCVPGSVDSEMAPGGCVIDPRQYEFTACPGAETEAISLGWTDTQYFNALSGYDVELVYTLLTSEQESSANNGADPAN